jgi:putative ABC transport system permease protein
MSLASIVWASICANRTRSLLLVITIAIAFMVYGVLGALRFSMFGGDDRYAESRLIITHESGMTQPLPIAYQQRLGKIPGVAQVSPATWFGAYYQSTKNMLMAFAVDAHAWVLSHREMEVSDADLRRFYETANGMLVSSALMDKYGWRVGDSVPLKSIMFQPKNGDGYWPFTVAGTFVNDAEAGGRNYILMHYNYLNEGRSTWVDTAGTYVVSAQPGVDVEQLSVVIDEFFSNYPERTASASDKAFHTAFFKQLGDISLLIKAVLSVCFTALILVVGSSLTLAVREKNRDIGIFKVVGFNRRRVLTLVAGEGLVLIVCGLLLGIAGALLVNYWVSTRLPDVLPNLSLTAHVWLELLLIAGLMGLVVCSLPALQALAMKPIHAISSEH